MTKRESMTGEEYDTKKIVAGLFDLINSARIPKEEPAPEAPETPQVADTKPEPAQESVDDILAKLNARHKSGDYRKCPSCTMTLIKEDLGEDYDVDGSLVGDGSLTIRRKGVEHVHDDAPAEDNEEPEEPASKTVKKKPARVGRR